MEDIKSIKLNKETAADLPRLEDGSIDLEAIAIGKDEKGNIIVPDDILDNYYRELPAGTINQSKTWRTSNNGKIRMFGGDPETDEAIRRKGNAANSLAWVQRRSIKEILEDLSKRTVTPEEAEAYQIEEGTTLLEAANLAQIRRAMRGDTKAAEYIRDTLGEKPSDKISAEITQLTAEDREMLQRVQARLDSM